MKETPSFETKGHHYHSSPTIPNPHPPSRDPVGATTTNLGASPSQRRILTKRVETPPSFLSEPLLRVRFRPLPPTLSSLDPHPLCRPSGQSSTGTAHNTKEHYKRGTKTPLEGTSGVRNPDVLPRGSVGKGISGLIILLRGLDRWRDWENRGILVPGPLDPLTGLTRT